MNSSFSPQDCYERLDALQALNSCDGVNIGDTIAGLREYCRYVEFDMKSSKMLDSLSSPMITVGFLIAIASSVCGILEVADLFNGFRNKKLWFPSKYFMLDSIFTMLVGVSMKLPVDLTSNIFTYRDRATKVGSLSLLCTMISNILLSLGSLDNKTLFLNVLGLNIFIITIVIDIGIQINDGMIEYTHIPLVDSHGNISFGSVASMITALVILQLIIFNCVAIFISTAKHKLESKYQEMSERISNDFSPRFAGVEKLGQVVGKYLIMAETASPQFVIAKSPLCCVSGVFSLISMIIQIVVMFYYIPGDHLNNLSPYKWTMQLIFITQIIVLLVGSIAPTFRLFSSLGFKLSRKWRKNHLKVFRVEHYWTQVLMDWKQMDIGFEFIGSRWRRNLVYKLKNILINAANGFCKTVVSSCKITWIILLDIKLLVMDCWRSLASRFFDLPTPSNELGINIDVSSFIVKLDDDLEFDERTLKTISNLANHLINNAVKEQPNHLLKLLMKSTSFDGVVSFDNDDININSNELVNSWSLAVLTLTSLAIALPGTSKDEVDDLLKGVGEGITYTLLVDKTFSSSAKTVDIQRVWYELQDNCKWMGISLKKDALKRKTTKQILQLFIDNAQEVIRKSSNEEVMGTERMIIATSMHRVCNTMMVNHSSSIQQIMHGRKLFSLLNNLIADILSACIVNIPQVILMKCQKTPIEERRDCVENAAKLFGNSKDILNNVLQRELPDLTVNQMTSILKWRTCLRNGIP